MYILSMVKLRALAFLLKFVKNLIEKNDAHKKKSQMMVVHAFNPRTWKAEARLAWFTL